MFIDNLISPKMVGSSIRQPVEPPCRIFYKTKGDTVFIIHVMRSERILRASRFDVLD